MALPGITFQQDLEKGFPLLTLRKIPTKVFVAEIIWYIMGSKNPDDFVAKYTKIWEEFMKDTPEIKSAESYGYRWRHHFQRDQLKGIIETLQECPTSRQEVVITWDPTNDGLGKYGIKRFNVPCPFTFVVNIINNRLNLHNIIRSNDMMLGNPHDVAGFALLAYILAAKLKVKPGILTTSISHAHVWDTQFEQAKTLLNRDFANHHHPEIKFKAEENYFERAEQGDETLLTEICDKLQTNYNPLPKIKMKVTVGYNKI